MLVLLQFSKSCKRFGFGCFRKKTRFRILSLSMELLAYIYG